MSSNVSWVADWCLDDINCYTFHVRTQQLEKVGSQEVQVLLPPLRSHHLWLLSPRQISIKHPLLGYPVLRYALGAWGFPVAGGR
jgi:hypothetical protein